MLLMQRYDLERVAGPSFQLVAKDGDKYSPIIAYVILTTKKKDEIYIGYLHVNENYRRQGFGTKVLQWIEKYAKGLRLRIAVGEKNDPAIKLYTKFGFKTYERVDGYFMMRKVK
jgi:ribosomal protein S18 acetylase RimI-like enzyme